MRRQSRIVFSYENKMIIVLTAVGGLFLTGTANAYPIEGVHSRVFLTCALAAV
jgi:hypothetical protein